MSTGSRDKYAINLKNPIKLYYNIKWDENMPQKNDFKTVNRVLYSDKNTLSLI